MVKVTKVAVWKIGNIYIESAKEAEKETRRVVIQEMIEATTDHPSNQVSGDWIADNWDEIEVLTKKAMAGT